MKKFVALLKVGTESMTTSVCVTPMVYSPRLI